MTACTSKNGFHLKDNDLALSAAIGNAGLGTIELTTYLCVDVNHSR